MNFKQAPEIAEDSGEYRNSGVQNESASLPFEAQPGSASYELKRKFSSLVIQIDRLRGRLLNVDAEWHPEEGKWSSKEILGHLIDCDRDIWGPRIHRILKEENPEFQQMDQDKLVRDHQWQNMQLPEITAQLMRVRWNNAIFVNGLSEEELNRTGQHFSRGTISIIDILQILTDHDAHHLTQIDWRIAECARHPN